MPPGHPRPHRRIGDPIVSIICAASRNGVIGIENRLPWRLPADLKRFKAITMNHPVIMGRKTFESIGKPLPGRMNIVITHQKDYQATGCQVAHSFEEALKFCQGADEVFVIGGASIYRQALPQADRIYLTWIHQDFQGDTFLFEINKSTWKETSCEDFKPDAENPYPYSFIIYERNR